MRIDVRDMCWVLLSSCYSEVFSNSEWIQFLLALSKSVADFFPVSAAAYICLCSQEIRRSITSQVQHPVALSSPFPSALSSHTHSEHITMPIEEHPNVQDDITRHIDRHDGDLVGDDQELRHPDPLVHRNGVFFILRKPTQVSVRNLVALTRRFLVLFCGHDRKRLRRQGCEKKQSSQPKPWNHGLKSRSKCRVHPSSYVPSTRGPPLRSYVPPLTNLPHVVSPSVAQMFFIPLPCVPNPYPHPPPTPGSVAMKYSELAAIKLHQKAQQDKDKDKEDVDGMTPVSALIPQNKDRKPQQQDQPFIQLGEKKSEGSESARMRVNKVKEALLYTKPLPHSIPTTPSAAKVQIQTRRDDITSAKTKEDEEIRLQKLEDERRRVADVARAILLEEALQRKRLEEEAERKRLEEEAKIEDEWKRVSEAARRQYLMEKET
ncbi:hypothetical protein ADUPG1_009824, partial [Aduncisulcus paluster]